MTDEADRIIAALDLTPHPEGGHYRETFRDSEGVNSRAHATTIYFLLRAGEVSRWHRVDATEIWLWHSGVPLELTIAGDNRETVNLGPDIAAGQHPQAIVPKGAWQMAKSLGGYTLVSCVVAPGFEFAGFELAEEGFEP
ncbi:MAG TPA: cupin domain-containing protein [Rhizomicrobium sp.]|jgi:predicted cupin superfamily sugar epimerase|nr:cupin domain-containing protein [Rhizomicrobium sp.]